MNKICYSSISSKKQRKNMDFDEFDDDQNAGDGAGEGGD